MHSHLHVDDWSWKTFLKPLTCARTEEGLFIDHLDDDDQPLVYRFREKLAKQHDEKSAQKVSATREAKAALTGTFTEADFEELKRRWKHYEAALNMKSDREISGSTWTISKLQRYIEHQDILFVQPKIESLCDLTFTRTLENIHALVDLAMKAVCGRRGGVKSLKNQPNSTECNTRKILDAIMQPLCVYKELTLRSEQTIKFENLPENRYDYILYQTTRYDCPIGVVEAKRQGYLKGDSVAQLLVQLLLLSYEEPNFFYFGVLSDAYQFIFAGVSQQKVWLFPTNENQLEIATVDSDDDMTFIVRKISWLIDFAIQSRKLYDPIEDLLRPSVATLKIQ